MIWLLFTPKTCLCRGAWLDFKRRELEWNRKISRGHKAWSILSKSLVWCIVSYFWAALLCLTERSVLIGGAPMLIRSDFAFVRCACRVKKKNNLIKLVLRIRFKLNQMNLSKKLKHYCLITMFHLNGPMTVKTHEIFGPQWLLIRSGGQWYVNSSIWTLDVSSVWCTLDRMSASIHLLWIQLLFCKLKWLNFSALNV